MMWVEMRFSAYYEIDRTDEDDWFDPILTSDTQLFVDPFLIYLDRDERWHGAHSRLIDFFNMALELVARSGFQRTSAAWRVADRLLRFPEPPEYCLGYGVEPVAGLGTGEGFGNEMLLGAETAIKESLRQVRHFEELTLFAPGIAEDRISDIVCNVIKREFIGYTQEVAERHGLELHRVPVAHLDWDRRFERWVDGTERLPKNPYYPHLGVLLVPARFLRQLPTATPEEFWDFAWRQHGAELRHEFDYDIGKNVDGRRIVALARAHPEYAGEYIAELEAGGGKPPYDLAEDPAGEVKWYDAGFELAAQAGGPRPPDDADEICKWVEELLEGFAHNVSQQDGWILLWTKDKNGNPKPATERYAQALLRTAVWQVCRMADVDFSGEPNAGRGPVDFKFSRGWHRRALAEVKRTNNSKFWHGLAMQTVQYLKSEQVNCGYFVVIGYRDADFTRQRLDLVRRAAATASRLHSVTIKPIFVDARPKKSASKAGG
jgi:hypothetical protein